MLISPNITVAVWLAEFSCSTVTKFLKEAVSNSTLLDSNSNKNRVQEISFIYCLKARQSHHHSSAMNRNKIKRSPILK